MDRYSGGERYPLRGPVGGSPPRGRLARSRSPSPKRARASLDGWQAQRGPGVVGGGSPPAPLHHRAYPPPAFPPCPPPHWLQRARLPREVHQRLEGMYRVGRLAHDTLAPTCCDYLERLSTAEGLLVLDEFAALEVRRIVNSAACFVDICRRVASGELMPPPVRGPRRSRSRSRSPHDQLRQQQQQQHGRYRSPGSPPEAPREGPPRHDPYAQQQQQQQAAGDDMEWRPTSGGAAAAAAAATAAAQPQGPPPDFDIRGDLIDYRHLAHLDLEYPWRRLHSMARLSGNGGVATSGIKGRYPKLCKAVADCATTLLQPLMQADRVSAPVADDVRERVVLRLLFLLPPAAATANGGAASSDGGADGAIDDAAAVEWFSSAGGGAQRRKVRQLLQGYLDNEGLPAAAAALLI